MTQSHFSETVLIPMRSDHTAKKMQNNKSISMNYKLGVWYKAAFLLLVSISFTSLQAQERTELIADFELSLSEAIQLSLANNPDINRALLATKDSDELVKIAYSEIYPEITSSINYELEVTSIIRVLPFVNDSVNIFE